MKTTFNLEGFLIALVILFFAILIIVLCIIPVKMANKRGRSAFGWLLFSLFFSPFLSMLFLALLGETDDKREERILEEEELKNNILNKFTRGMKKCPKCAELIKEEAIVCRYCGNDKSNIIELNSNVSGFEEWKKQNENLNEFYKDLKENQITISPIIDIPKPVESEPKEEKQFNISPIAKVIIFGILIIALFRYEYIGQQAKVAWKYIGQKTNLIEDPDGFNETSFASREEEVKYIREYANYKFGLFRDKYFTDYFNNLDSYRSKKEIEKSKTAARPITDLMIMMYMTEPLMKEVVRQNLSISKVKERLNSPEFKKIINNAINNNLHKNISKSKIENYPIKETVYETENIDNEAVEAVDTGNKDSILNEVILMNTTPK